MAILGISVGGRKLDMRQLKLIRRVTELMRAMDIPRPGELPQLGRSWRNVDRHRFLVTRILLNNRWSHFDYSSQMHECFQRMAIVESREDRE